MKSTFTWLATTVFGFILGTVLVGVFAGMFIGPSHPMAPMSGIDGIIGGLAAIIVFVLLTLVFVAISTRVGSFLFFLRSEPLFLLGFQTLHFAMVLIISVAVARALL